MWSSVVQSDNLRYCSQELVGSSPSIFSLVKCFSLQILLDGFYLLQPLCVKRSTSMMMMKNHEDSVGES